MNVNTIALRRFLIDIFDAGELKAFLFDYFREVFNDVTPSMSKSQQIQMLLEYCQNNGRYPDLFADLEQERPGSFQRSDFTDDLEMVQNRVALGLNANPSNVALGTASTSISSSLQKRRLNALEAAWSVSPIIGLLRTRIANLIEKLISDVEDS